ncbi:MAG: tetratricopeptide repeat protein [Anaerolineae bacterium]|nr:tetratricopeptide repeat protein [Anaerolineae bacterium]
METLRTFAYEQLVSNDQLWLCQQNHARYYTTFAQEVFAGLLGDDQVNWMQYALADHENCLTALRWALAQANGEIAIAIAGGLWWFWCRRGLFLLGLEMLQAALQLATPDLSARAVALNGLASIYLSQDDYAHSLAVHREGLALRHQLHDATGMYTVLHNMGLTAYMMGDYDQAITWLNEGVAADPTSDPTQAWAHLGLIAQEMQDLPQALVWLEQAYERVMQQSEGWMQAWVMNYLADVLRETGEFARATQLAQASLQIFTAWKIVIIGLIHK